MNAYNPGIVRTAMRDEIDKKTAQIKGISIEQQQQNCLNEIYLGREGRPEDQLKKQEISDLLKAISHS